MSVLLTVPLGPTTHPSSSSPGSQPTPYDLRVRASEVLSKIVALYGSKYPGLLPRQHPTFLFGIMLKSLQGLLSTLTKTLNSSPFPSPLGASNPPAGRYEGAILGLAALGGPAVLSGLWGTGTDELIKIDNLAGSLYPGEGRRGRTAIMKACIVS